MRACPHCKTPYTSAIEFCGIDGSRLVESDTDPLIGAVIDRYRVVERIGGGGMAAVYRAVHTVIDRQCALKVLFGELASDKAFSERFRHEAQASSRIKHENVVEVLDFGTTPEGASFLLMELLEGQTLGAAIHAAGTLDPKRAAWITREIAAGLAAAHAIGFVHRDLKPANIMLVDDKGVERAKILDFGLVSSREEDGGDGGALTKTGQTLGTPFYMAPEQIEGRAITGRTDIYALGIILHEMLSGARPFVGSLSEVLLQHASEPPPPLPPAGGLEELAAWMLEKSPAKRPASAVVVVREIEKLSLLPKEAPSLVLPVIPAERLQPAPPAPPRVEPLETRAERVPALHKDGPSSASVLFPPSKPGLPSAANMPSGALDGAAASLIEGASAQTETSVQQVVQVRQPSRVDIAPPPRDERPRARGPTFAVVVAVVVGVAAFVLVGGADRARALLQPLLGAAEDVGEKAVTVALAAPAAVSTRGPAPPEPPPEPTVDARLIAQLEADLAAALRKRGLARSDLANLPKVAPLVRRYEDARDATDVSALHTAHAALVTEIARAPLSARVVNGAIARVAQQLRERTDSFGPKRLASLERRLRDLQSEAKKQRSEAERGRLMLAAAALEADLARRR